MSVRTNAWLAILNFLVVATMAGQPAAHVIENWSAPPLWSPGGAAGKVLSGGDLALLGEQAVEAVPTSALPFMGIAPCRIVDTRGNGFTGTYGPPSLSAGVSRDFVLAGQCGISAAAEVVSLNVTVTNTQGSGHIVIYPAGGAQPTVSTLNYTAGETIANAAVVPLGAGGAITVVAGVSGTNLILDTNGYYGGPIVTNVTPGTGLTGGGTGAVLLGIASGGVGTAELADAAVTGSKISVPLTAYGSFSGLGIIQAVNDAPYGIGLRGFADNQGSGVEGSSAYGVGVYGFGPLGVGVRGQASTGGIAMEAYGSTRQTRDRGGWIKGLARQVGGAFTRCYDSQAADGAAAESCGKFTVSVSSPGDYTVTFPFTLDDRFVLVTTESADAGPPRCCLVQYNFTNFVTQVRVRIWDSAGNPVARSFTIAVF